MYIEDLDSYFKNILICLSPLRHIIKYSLLLNWLSLELSLISHFIFFCVFNISFIVFAMFA